MCYTDFMRKRRCTALFDWREIPKIDAHIHLLPENVISANSGCGDPFVDYGSVGDYLNLMKSYNIEGAFIMPFNDPYMLSMDFTVESVHGNLQQMVRHAPERLYCFADVDIRDSIDETLAELERVLGKDGFVGIKIHPSNAGYPIDGAYYDAIFHMASERGIPVEVHSYPREHLMDDVSSPARIKKVLENYSKLKLSIAHLGGFQYEMLMGTNAYCNLSAVLPELVNRLGIEESNRILRLIGVEKLVFATDYPDSRSLKPTEIYETYFDILNKMDFTREEAEMICKENARKMTGI